MKALLISPPSFNIIRESLPPVVEDSTGYFPPLGLLYIASYAEAVPDVTVEVLDCQAEELSHEQIERRIAACAPDVVGIQVMTFTLIDSVAVARAVRKVAPKACIVFGGPHATLYPFETAALPEADAVVEGEGENPFEGLLRALMAGTPLEAVPGVLTKASKVLPGGQQLRYIEDLDELKSPARHLLDLSRYSSALASEATVTTMMSSRGCPGKCIFCDRPQMGKRFRKRSARSVVEEMAHCSKVHGISEIVFYDDTFTVDKKRVLEICDRLIELRLGLVWDIRARIDTMTPEMIDRLAQAGCARIHYGVETGDPRLQKVIRKNLDLDKVREVFAYTRKKGVETLGYFMIGLPEEGPAELERTFEMMRTLPMDYVHVGVFTPYPGTEIYRQALERGVYPTDYWREFALDPKPDFTPRYWNEHFTDEQLLALLKKAYAQFYARPGYLLYRLSKVRSFSELWRKGWVGMKLLREVTCK